MRKRFTTALLALVMMVGSLAMTAGAAQAANKEKMWRLGTYAGGAALAYGLLKKKKTITYVGAGVGVLSYLQWQKEKKKRRQREGRRR